MPDFAGGGQHGMGDSLNPSEKKDNVNRNENDKHVNKSKREQLKENLRGDGRPKEQDPHAEAMSSFNSQTEIKVPPRDEEIRYKEETEGAEGDNVEESDSVDEVEAFSEDADVEPINPFEYEVAGKTIDTKSLDDRPLDRKNAEIKQDETEEKSEDADEANFAEEKQNEEQEDFSDNEEQSQQEQVLDLGAQDVEVLDVEDSDSNIEPFEDTTKEQEKSGEEKVQHDEFKESFWDILEQAGITKGRLVGALLGLVIFITVLYFLFSGLGGGDEAGQDSSGGQQVDDQQSGGEGAPTGPSQAYGVVSSYIFGLEYNPQTPIVAEPIGSIGNLTGVQAGFALGGNFESDQIRFVYYMGILRDMQNIFATDVYQLMDTAIDRRAAIDKHLEEIDRLLEDGVEAYNEIVQIQNSLDLNFEASVVERDLYEQQFFAFSQALLGQGAYDNLNLFIEKSNETNEVKAYFNAYSLLRDMFVNSVTFLEPRYQDILVNKEALIKGVRVFDIPDSDINAIIRLPNEE